MFVSWKFSKLLRIDFVAHFVDLFSTNSTLQGNITNTAPGLRRRGWAEIMEESSKIVTFLDLVSYNNLRVLEFCVLGYILKMELFPFPTYTGRSRELPEDYTVRFDRRSA